MRNIVLPRITQNDSKYIEKIFQKSTASMNIERQKNLTKTNKQNHITSPHTLSCN